MVGSLYELLPAEAQAEMGVEWEGKVSVTFSDTITAVRRWRLHALLAQWSGELVHAYQATFLRPDQPRARLADFFRIAEKNRSLLSCGGSFIMEEETTDVSHSEESGHGRPPSTAAGTRSPSCCSTGSGCRRRPVGTLRAAAR